MLVTVIHLFILLKWGEYDLDYWEDISDKYEEVTERFGEPNQLIYEEKYYCAYYDEIEIVCYNNGTTYLAIITDEDIRFGFLNIGIGSHKTLIEGIYCLKEKMIDLNENEIGIKDGIDTIIFEYDENDKVKKIYLSRWYW